MCAPRRKAELFFGPRSASPLGAAERLLAGRQPSAPGAPARSTVARAAARPPKAKALVSCPDCGRVEAIVVHYAGGRTGRLCAACGYAEQPGRSTPAVSSATPTRAPASVATRESEHAVTIWATLGDCIHPRGRKTQVRVENALDPEAEREVLRALEDALQALPAGTCSNLVDLWEAVGGLQIVLAERLSSQAGEPAHALATLGGNAVSFARSAFARGWDALRETVAHELSHLLGEADEGMARAFARATAGEVERPRVPDSEVKVTSEAGALFRLAGRRQA